MPANYNYLTQDPQGRDVNYQDVVAAMRAVGANFMDPNNVYNLATGTYGEAAPPTAAQLAPTDPNSFTGETVIGPNGLPQVMAKPGAAMPYHLPGVPYAAPADAGGATGFATAGPGYIPPSSPHESVDDYLATLQGGSGAAASTPRARSMVASQTPAGTVAPSPNATGVGTPAPAAVSAATPQTQSPVSQVASRVTPAASAAPAVTIGTQSGTSVTANTAAANPSTSVAMPQNQGPLTMSGTGDIIGSSANFYDPAYGGIPNVPDPISSQYQSLVGNISNLGSIYNLAGGINQFGAQQAKGQYEANLPGYDEMTAQASQDIAANLAGQVPADVINELQQGAAERGIATGAAGSPNAGAQYLKALGLTSLGQEATGQQQLTQAIQRTPTSPLFNVASMLVSPNDEQAARMAANLYAAAPQPRAAAEQAIANAKAGLAAGGGSGGTSVNLAGAAPPNTGPWGAGGATSPYTTTVLGGTGTGTGAGIPPGSMPYYPVNTYNVPGNTVGNDPGVTGGTGDYGGIDPNTGIPYEFEAPSGTGTDYGTTGGDEWWNDPNYDPFGDVNAGVGDVTYDPETGLLMPG